MPERMMVFRAHMMNGDGPVRAYRNTMAALYAYLISLINHSGKTACRVHLKYLYGTYGNACAASYALKFINRKIFHYLLEVVIEYIDYLSGEGLNNISISGEPFFVGIFA